MEAMKSKTRVVSTLTLVLLLAAAGHGADGQVATGGGFYSTEADFSEVPKGAIAVRHGRGMLAPPAGLFLSFGLVEDIPHTGMYLGGGRTYDLRIVDKEGEMRQIFGLNAADYPNGESVIFQTIPDDKTPKYSFEGRFKNVGWFSIVESEGKVIYVIYRGTRMKFKELPPEVKEAIVEKVCEKAEKEVGPIERTEEGGRQARPGEKYGTYDFTKANCLHPILRMYDDALEELGITVVVVRGDDGKSHLGPGESRDVIPSKRIPGTNYSTAPKKVIVKETTLTELLTVFGILDTSLVNDFFEPVRRRKTKKRGGRVRGTHDDSVGVEAGPVSAAMIALWTATAAAQPAGRALSLEDLLPTDALRGDPVVSIPRQTMLAEFNANAVDARALDFRVNGRTAAVVLVTKTLRRPYFHEYHVCPRFYGWVLDDVASVRLGARNQQAGLPGLGWFWLSSTYDDRYDMSEVAAQFVVVVDEADHRMTVDSRWLSKQYCPYWRNAPGQGGDYFLNFQVWSSSEENTCHLVESVLSRLHQLGRTWNVAFANQEEPKPPAVFIEAAWLVGDVIHVWMWNRLWTPCLAAFHGTAQSSEHGEDVFFQHWEPVYPGRNRLQLSRGELEWRDNLKREVSPPPRIHNAVVHCEADGFLDKVFVSVDKRRSKPLPPAPAFAGLQGKPTAPGPKIGISWPADNARVAVLRDQLDMPGDFRLAVNGTVFGAPRGSKIHVYVHTDKYYEPVEAEVHDGLWGARVYLEGKAKDGCNNHRIYAMLHKNRQEIAHDSVEGIVRLGQPIEDDRGPNVGEGGAASKVIRLRAADLDCDAGTHRWKTGEMTIGGGPDGCNDQGGSAWCKITPPEDASALKLRLFIEHGTDQQYGKGLHSNRKNGAVTVFVNRTPVHTIVCKHEHMYDHYWPEPRAELGRELAEIDLASKGIRGDSLTIKITASPGTCMDLRSVKIELKSR